MKYQYIRLGYEIDKKKIFVSSIRKGEYRRKLSFRSCSSSPSSLKTFTSSDEQNSSGDEPETFPGQKKLLRPNENRKYTLKFID